MSNNVVENIDGSTVIKDKEGKYELKADPIKNRLYQTTVGLWKEADIERFTEDVMDKMIPVFKGHKWACVTDVRQFKASAISEKLNNLLETCKSKGFFGGAIIVDSAVVKMQLNMASKKSGLAQKAFTDTKECEEWLDSQGY
ncbi:hypothetical protein ACJDT4_22890 [Clostridium neuense]|uniref:STAS/SEC14 domain-containing protein n=1 Tax=Clostridium neuense TaxID=1728934 RepID=A0ABW8TMA7_9CLOT